MLGDTTAPGPVLKSNENSMIFFNFVDHGAPGYCAMPNGDKLKALDLKNVIN